MKGMRDWAMWESGVEHLAVRRASANVLGRGGGSITCHVPGPARSPLWLDRESPEGHSAGEVNI